MRSRGRSPRSRRRAARDAAYSRHVRPPPAGAPRPAVIASFSACTATIAPSRAQLAIPSCSVSVVGAREVVDAAGRHERLEPDHAALVRAPRAARRCRAPSRPTARSRRPRTPSRPPAWRRSRPVELGGCALSGISMHAVMPPTASAAVPVAMPSQSVRPGSLRCTCGSTPPGSTCSPVAVDHLGGSPPTRGPISATTPPEPRRPAPARPPGSHASVPPRTRVNQVMARVFSPRGHELAQHGGAAVDVLLGPCLVGVVADAARAGDEQHPDSVFRRGSARRGTAPLIMWRRDAEGRARSVGGLQR